MVTPPDGEKTDEKSLHFYIVILEYAKTLIQNLFNAGAVMSLEVNGATIDLDDDGYLVDRTQWNQDVALALAKTEDVEMSDQHWEIVNFLRSYYEEYQIAPMIKILAKEIAKIRDIDKREASKVLYDLFPSGPAKQACKIAGLPKPTGCV